MSLHKYLVSTVSSRFVSALTHSYRDFGVRITGLYSRTASSRPCPSASGPITIETCGEAVGCGVHGPSHTTSSSRHHPNQSLRAAESGRGADGEGEGRQRRPRQPLDRRLVEVAKAVGGGYCRLQMPLKLAPGRETVAVEAHAMLLPEIDMYGTPSVDKANQPQPQNHRKPQTVTQNQKTEPPNSMVPKVKGHFPMRLFVKLCNPAIFSGPTIRRHGAG